MRCRTLRKSSIENLTRFATWLGLRTNGMSKNQIVRLIRWRVAYNRFDNQEYDSAISIEGVRRAPTARARQR